MVEHKYDLNKMIIGTTQISEDVDIFIVGFSLCFSAIMEEINILEEIYIDELQIDYNK